MIDDILHEIKQLGSYYTPANLAQIIASNAIKQPECTVFDPSFGHGSLLEAAGIQLLAKNNPNPELLLYGVDIDKSVLDYSSRELAIPILRRNIRVANFLSLRPSDFKEAPFDVILSNPPFTRHQNIPISEKSIAKRSMKNIGIDVDGKSGYWVYFLLHSLNFLKIGGHLSILVPYAILDAEYAKSLHEVVRKSFKRVTLHILHTNYFTNTQEHVLLLDAFDYKGIGEFPKGQISTVLNGLDGLDLKTPPNASGWNILPILLNQKTIKLFSELENHSDIFRLGEIATVRIGVVTGSNRYFIISKSEAEELSLDEELLQPIITRSEMLNGLYLDSVRLEQIISEDKDSFLIRTSSTSKISMKFAKYLNNDESKIVKQGYHCRNRSPWHSVKLGIQPDAFIHYMVTVTPNIMLNETSATCTNTIHRINWTGKLTKNKSRIITISSLTSLSNLSAEIFGRSLAGGLLKIEPTQVSRILIPMPDFKISDNDWKLLHSHLLNGTINDAVEFADELILENALEINKKQIKLLRGACNALMEFRRNRKVVG